jgi:hypothetical protein
MDEAWRLADAATVAGKRAEFIRWLKEVRYRLAYEADEWGEGRGFLPGLKLETRVGVAGGLVVWYAVDPDRRVVFVQRFRMRGDPGAGVQGGA